MEVPHDIAFEIFSRLPASSICKFKSTCIPYSKFSEESFFKTKQACNLFGRDDTYLFIQPNQANQKVTKIIELHSLSKHQQSSGVPTDILSFLSNNVSIIASSNGLVLCHFIEDKDDSNKLFICNPITKSCFSIPTPESVSFANVKLMLHCSLDDYKVFLFKNTLEWQPSCYTCSVYNGKDGVWKTMEHGFKPGGRDMNLDMPVFYNGALHVISDSGRHFTESSPFYEPYIMSYNLENGISTMLRLPEEAVRGCRIDECNMGIFNWGKASNSNGSICLVILKKSVFTVWFLEDYEKCAWQEVFEKSVEELGLKEKDHKVTEFTVVNGDLLVFATEEERVYSCGLNAKRLMVEEVCQHNCGCHPRFISYLDTFRLCGIETETMPC